MKKLLVFIVVVGAGAAGIYYWKLAPRTLTLTEAQLTFANLQQVTMRDQVSATGVLEARDLVFVASEMPGVVRTVQGKVNQTVAEGAVLAQLDDRKLRLKLEEAVNAITTAKAALVQASALKDAAHSARQYIIDQGKVGIRVDLLEAEAKLKAAEAGVEAAQARIHATETARKEAELALDMAVIKVPSVSSADPNRKYLILRRDVHDGQMVGPQGMPMFVLSASLERMDVHAQVAEGDINKVKAGQAAMFMVSTYADKEAEFRGVVKEIRPQATNVRGAVFYDTVIEVANRRDADSGEWQLRPGMNVSIDIVRVEHKDVWRVPTAALNFKLEDAFLSAAAQAKLDEWKQRPDHADWGVLWTWHAQRQSPWPLFVRIGGQKNGEMGLKDGEGNEILEWEPGFVPSAASPPRVIITAPPAVRPGFFDRPANIKVS